MAAITVDETPTMVTEAEMPKVPEWKRPGYVPSYRPSGRSLADIIRSMTGRGRGHGRSPSGKKRPSLIRWTTRYAKVKDGYTDEATGEWVPGVWMDVAESRDGRFRATKTEKDAVATLIDFGPGGSGPMVTYTRKNLAQARKTAVGILKAEAKARGEGG